jgi:hypothetical protein
MGTDDFALKALLDQFRHPADVIDVGMGEKQVVDLSRRYGPVVHGVVGIAALGQAAVHHDGQAVGLQQVAGAGDALKKSFELLRWKPSAVLAIDETALLLICPINSKSFINPSFFVSL